VPNYNHADYLDERISTIVNQTYQNIEVLLMDDCSPDESRSVLEKWAAKDDRLEVLFNEKNSGSPFAQWARGSAWAKGKYLWIAESDDACALDMLALHVDALERNEKAAMAYSHSHLVDEEGAFLRDFKDGLWIHIWRCFTLEIGLYDRWQGGGCAEYDFFKYDTQCKRSFVP
jgi:glycosyltransferase involved in cell wall biosynthesis